MLNGQTQGWKCILFIAQQHCYDDLNNNGITLSYCIMMLHELSVTFVNQRLPLQHIGHDETKFIS